jgi:CysZ protein
VIVDSLMRALGQMGDARFRGVLLRAIAITLGVLLAFSALLIWGAGWLVGDSLTLPWIGTVTWVDNVLSWAMVPVTLVLSVVLMVPVASAVTGMFLEDVAAAVEDRHYPQLGDAPAVAFSDGLRDSLGFLGTMAIANLLALVLYLLFVPLAPVIFWALNGFLLGREYFVLAAMRRVGRKEAHRLFRRHIVPIWAGGVLMALPLSVPVLNLLVPVVGAATFTHVYHRLTGPGGGV